MEVIHCCTTAHCLLAWGLIRMMHGGLVGCKGGCDVDPDISDEDQVLITHLLMDRLGQ